MKLLKNIWQKFRYKLRVFREIRIFKNNQKVHDLPDIFHYWSNKYLLPKHQPFGFINPEDFFEKYCLKICQKHKTDKKIKFLSIGSGNGELEVGIAKKLVAQGFKKFSIECLDLNKHMLERTIKLAESQLVSDHIKINQGDFNQWQPKQQYDLILANQSLHHVVELEHLFDSIHEGLTDDGLFITSDMIGRNGHMRWPEALELIKPLWKELPKEYKYNQLVRRYEKEFKNYDCSKQSFEGIRAQDILPLLVQKFNFELFIPFANLIMVFIDRPFGHHFNCNKQNDLDFIDKVHQQDEEAILNGTIKPTQMFAVLAKAHVKKIHLLNPVLTPEFCIRKV